MMLPMQLPAEEIYESLPTEVNIESGKTVIVAEWEHPMGQIWGEFQGRTVVFLTGEVPTYTVMEMNGAKAFSFNMTKDTRVSFIEVKSDEELEAFAENLALSGITRTSERVMGAAYVCIPRVVSAKTVETSRELSLTMEDGLTLKSPIPFRSPRPSKVIVSVGNEKGLTERTIKTPFAMIVEQQGKVFTTFNAEVYPQITSILSPKEIAASVK